MRNIKLTLEYDGSRYKGWQRLGNDQQTVQGKIEGVLSRMTESEVGLIGCGRTDAGVHAIDYTANFHTDTQMKTEQILKYLNEYLPEDIIVKTVRDASERFHSRYNIISKTYLYRIDNSLYGSVFGRRYAHHVAQRLDIQAMKECAEVLTGTHDFQSFTTLKSKTKSTVRTVNYIEVAATGETINIEINGNGFLWNMVRIIMGTLIEAGSGRLNDEDVKSILLQKKRSQAGPMVPAKGLFLKCVEY